MHKPITKDEAKPIFGWNFYRVKEYKQHGETQLAVCSLNKRFLDLLYWKNNKVWGYLTSIKI